MPDEGGLLCLSQILRLALRPGSTATGSARSKSEVYRLPAEAYGPSLEWAHGGEELV